MLKLRNISKSYKSKAFTQDALIDISLDLPSTGMVFIIGKSGSGKTTLLNLIGGIDKPNSGEIFYRNEILDLKKPQVADNYRCNETSFIFQNFNLMNSQTVYENIASAAEIQGRNLDSTEISKLLDSVGLRGLALKKANELSIGQIQRVAIARSLYKKAKVILADEPTGNLDSENAKAIFELLKKESKNILVIVATHDIEMAEMYGDRIIELKDGVVINDKTLNIETDKINVHESVQTSKISILYILKISFNFLLKRKGKTFLAFILTLMSVIFFGISLVILIVDPIDIMVKSLEENNIQYVYLRNDNNNYMEKIYLGDEFAPLHKNFDTLDKDGEQLFWADYTVEIPNFDKFNLNFIHGTYPKTFTQIAITDYIAEKTFLRYSEKFSSIEELIGETFSFGLWGLKEDIDLEVSGIIKTKYRVDADSITGDCLFPHHYVKSGFFEYYREKIIYGEGLFVLDTSTRNLDSLFFMVNDQAPSITTSNNPSLFSSDIKVITESGFVNIKELELVDNEVLLNINYYNYLFREEKGYLTPENILDNLPSFNETIKLNFYDRYIEDLTYTTQIIKVKGIIYDQKNEPITDTNFEYNYASLCLILSDDLFNSIVKYYKMPVEYIIDLSTPNISDIFRKHHPLANNKLTSDKIYTDIDFSLELYLSKLNKVKYIFVAMATTFTIFSMLLIYHNTKNNIEKNLIDVGILRALGASKRHIMFIFLNESLVLLTLILPLSIISINFVINELNKNFTAYGYTLRILNFNFINLSILISFIILVILLSIILPLLNFMRKTPVEMIRRI